MIGVRSSQWLVACLVLTLGDLPAIGRREPIALALLESWLRTVDRLLCGGSDGDTTPRRALAAAEVDAAVRELVERCTGVAAAVAEGEGWARGFGPQGFAVGAMVKRLAGLA